MDNLTGSMKDVAFATSPREFDLSYSTTLEEIMEKLNASRTASQMPFQIKGGMGILSSAKRNEESKMSQVCIAVFCRNDMLFSVDRQICASLKDIGREL